MTEQDGDPGAWLFRAFQDQLNRGWSEKRDIYANSKGSSYEEGVAEFLRSYFGGIYDIRTRGAVIDREKRTFDLFDFKEGDDELDVLASFKNASPRAIFETGSEKAKLHWIPYNSLAFVCEVKSQLTKSALKKDLGKLRKLSELDSTLGDSVTDRFGGAMTGGFTVHYPLRCLVYDRASIDDGTLREVLSSNLDVWDLLLIVETDTLILNRNLPFARDGILPEPSDLEGKDAIAELPDGIDGLEELTEDVIRSDDFRLEADVLALENSLAWFPSALSLSIPQPFSVNAAPTLMALERNSDLELEATTEVNPD